MTLSHPTPVWRRWAPPLVAAALATALGAALLRPAAGAVQSPLIGKAAPDFALKSLDGAAVRLRALRGRPVVVNFWASWCVPCREEAPLFRELSARQGPGQGLAVLGILFQEPSDRQARDFIAEYQLAYPALRDPRADTAINYGVAGVPETFFIDAGGTVRDKVSGGLNRERLNAGLQRIGVGGL